MGITRNIYAVSYIAFSAAAVTVGLSARVLMPALMEGGDPELALPQMAMGLMPALMVGLILAGVFSAVVSTADSQILSCSAALTQDLFPKMSHSYKLAKLGTVVVTIIILSIALASNKEVLGMVRFAWSVLGAGLGPLLMLRAWHCPVSSTAGVLMMLVGVMTTVIWDLGLQLSGSINESLPGILAGFAVYGIVTRLEPMLNQPGSKAKGS